MLNIRFVVALLLVFIAFFISLGGGFLTKNIAIHLLDMTTLVASSEAPSQAAAAQSLSEFWKAKSQILSLFLDDRTCEQIENLILQVYSAAEQEDPATCDTACMQLAQQLNVVIGQEKISLYNLF